LKVEVKFTRVRTNNPVQECSAIIDIENPFTPKQAIEMIEAGLASRYRILSVEGTDTYEYTFTSAATAE